MRHFLANLATYAIGTLLIVGAVLFAWMRSSQLQLSDEATVLAGHAPAQGRPFDWRELGERSYVANCASCHGRGGAGWDQYPGVGHSSALLAAPGGRDYFIDLHLYGLTSNRWRVPMPPMGHIRDVELAAVMNHVLTNFGNATPDEVLFKPDDVAARRGQSRRPADVNADRPDVLMPR